MTATASIRARPAIETLLFAIRLSFFFFMDSKDRAVLQESLDNVEKIFNTPAALGHMEAKGLTREEMEREVPAMLTLQTARVLLKTVIALCPPPSGTVETLITHLPSDPTPSPTPSSSPTTRPVKPTATRVLSRKS